MQSIPRQPGVYYFKSSEGITLYVGKARCLRTRLLQYRAARRGKMRKIVRAAGCLEFETCPSEWDACLRELRLIQTLKPRLNVAAAFSHRYPLVGFLVEPRKWQLCLTTHAQGYPSYCFFGAYRSWSTTADAFFGLVQALKFVGHACKIPSPKNTPGYAYQVEVRQMPTDWDAHFQAFLRGESDSFLSLLLHRLLDNAGARHKAGEIQEAIDALATFWEEEALPLHKAISLTGWTEYPVAQTERDPLFLKARMTTRPPECES